VPNEPLAQLFKRDARFEFVYPEYGLTLRAPYAEWIFEAAAEILSRIEKLRIEGTIEELEMIKEFEDPDTINTQIDTIKYENGNRFDVIPQCIVTMADVDYRWVSPVARDPKSNNFGQRLHDMSLTRSDDYASRNGQTEPQFKTNRI
jgi:hypothetical protein